MRNFVVYTLARLGLFLAVYGLIWLALFRSVSWDSVSALYTALLAMVVSSLLAFVMLRRQRQALAADIASVRDLIPIASQPDPAAPTR